MYSSGHYKFFFSSNVYFHYFSASFSLHESVYKKIKMGPPTRECINSSKVDLTIWRSLIHERFIVSSTTDVIMELTGEPCAKHVLYSAPFIFNVKNARLFFEYFQYFDFSIYFLYRCFCSCLLLYIILFT